MVVQGSRLSLRKVQLGGVKTESRCRGRRSGSNRRYASKKSPALSGAMWCPYRKPTQVGEERILRRLRELWPRNSANFHRNFGRRWVFGREGTCSWSGWRSQRNGGSDCLPKTQDSANSKEDV